MVNYNNGKIYKIEPLNGDEADIYIGSTTKEHLSQRMVTHRSDYKRFLNGKKSDTTAYNLFNKYGIENCKIILLELVNVNSKDELLEREAHYIKALNCVNKVVPLRTPNEYREDNKDKIKANYKEYYERNKDKIKKYNDMINKRNKIKTILRRQHKQQKKDEKKNVL